MHKDFSADRSGGLVFPSLRIFQFVVIHVVKGFGVVNKAEVDVFLGEGNGNPLQSSCLENPMGKGAW